MGSKKTRCIQEEKSKELEYLDFLKITGRHKLRIKACEKRLDWLFKQAEKGVERVETQF